MRGQDIYIFDHKVSIFSDIDFRSGQSKTGMFPTPTISIFSSQSF